MTVDTRPVVVIGLGKTGLSVLQYLYPRVSNLMAMDTRPNPPALAEIHSAFPTLPILLGDLPAEPLLQAREIIVAPGLATATPAIAAAMAAGVSVIGDIELFARVATQPVVAITGSNGKSTVTTLVGQMAQAAGKRVFVGGNLGTPVLQALADPTYELYVLELSSFQLETTYSLKPAAATILNITPDHMDRYLDFAAYQAAKQRIYQHTQAAIYNRDDLHTLPSTPISRSLSFGLDTPASGEFGLLTHAQDTFLALGDEPWLNTREIKLRGQHNMANALAALALGYAVGLPKEAMLAALKAFQGLPHRSEWVGQFNGIDWYNDSKGTNVDATLATLKGLGAHHPGKIVLIAGGEGKGADFSVLAPAVQHYVRNVIVFGKDALQLASALQSVCGVTQVRDLQQAVLTAKQVAQEGDIVLLSPACASLDMFINFEHRGAEFVRLVKEYVQ